MVRQGTEVSTDHRREDGFRSRQAGAYKREEGVLSDAQKRVQAKMAELEKAQAELRKVLSVRQEGIATLNGWL